MFSNRFFKTKLIGALVVIACLGVYSASHGRSINPALWRCMAEPERWTGAEVRAGGTAVDVTAEGFTLDTDRVRVPVTGVREEVTEGAHVTVRGTFHAEGPHITMMRLRHEPTGSDHRWLIELISLFVLACVLWNFHRKFSVHPESLHVRGSD